MSSPHETILLLGRTGVGKSSLINGIVRRDVAPVGEWMPTTMRVDRYETEHDGTRWMLIDTPGLCDDLPEVGNDARYLEMIRAGAARVDHVWFVTRLDSTRVEADEKRGIRMITEALGADLWKRGVIVFTFRDRVAAAKTDHVLATRARLIRREIEAAAGAGTAREIRAVTVNSHHTAGLYITRGKKK
jgi:predicted GTPase